MSAEETEENMDLFEGPPNFPQEENEMMDTNNEVQSTTISETENNEMGVEEGEIPNQSNLQIINPNELLSNITNSLYFFEQDAPVNNNPVFSQIFNNLVNEINANYEEERQLDEALQESFNSYNQLERNGELSLNIVPFKYATLSSEIKKEQKVCSICTDKFYYNQDVIKTECCNNCFHFKCLNEWVKYKNDCPTCREKFESK